MLTLPDTDHALLTATAQNDKRVLIQRINRATPWAAAQQAESNVAYLHTDKGWLAAQLEPASEAVTADNFAARTHSPVLLDAPVVLMPAVVPKPWGQEIWFSGIEARGESTVRQASTTLTLSDYLALAPQHLTRRAMPLLLKILDPAPGAENGCLYFETHNTKQEVYVVTRIDSNAWPGGEGAIRLGMNQSKRKDFATDEAFRDAYLAAIERYEVVRRKIDDTTTGTSADGSEQLQEEQVLRHAMESFTALKPLRVGDVVQVSPHVPHALQNGVRVFEFQTPTYERNIISFNQRVLTQDHWDSRYAVKHMQLDAPNEPVIETLSNEPGQRLERIVDFDDFDVLRVTLAQDQQIDADLSRGYMMVAIIEGSLTIDNAAGSVTLNAASERLAALVPAAAAATRLTSGHGKSNNATVFLLARPKAVAAGKIPPA